MTLRYQHLFTTIDSAVSNSAKNKPFRIMEIGCFDGIRANQMINRAANSGRTHIDFFGFDLFEELTREISEAEFCNTFRPKNQQKVLATVISNRKVKDVKLIKGDSKKTVPQLLTELPKMDIILIDGGKSLGTIQSDIEYCLKLAGEYTKIIIDGYYPGDYSKGCALLVDGQLSKRVSLNVEIIEPADINPDTGLTVKLVRISKTGKLDNVEAPEIPATPAAVIEEVPSEPAHNPKPSDSVCDSDIQSPGLCANICPDSTCEHAKQHCDGSRRCESGVGGINLELPTAGPIDTASLHSERQEPDQKLELGTVESQGVESTNNGSDEQRRDISEKLVESHDENTSRKSRRARRSRNKRSGSSPETTDSQSDDELSDNG